MRIIGTIDHPSLKITVFKMDARITVKIENPSYEIGIKLGAHDQLNTLEAIKNWLDAQLLASIDQTLTELHASRLAADNRNFATMPDSEFEEII